MFQPFSVLPKILNLTSMQISYNNLFKDLCRKFYNLRFLRYHNLIYRSLSIACCDLCGLFHNFTWNENIPYNRIFSHDIKMNILPPSMNWTSGQYNKFMKIAFITLLLCFPQISARPWIASDIENEIGLISQSPSQLVTTIDSFSVRFSKALKTASPTLTPLLSIASLGYVGYVASVMLFPSALKEYGIPLLEDFKFESRSTRTSETGFIDSLATGFLKDMIVRTEAADILKNTSMNAVKDGMGKLKKTTRLLNLGLGSLQGISKTLSTILTPECLSRYMCQVGQFTGVRMPALGAALRSLK